MIVKILGTGCKKCQTLEIVAKKAAAANNIKAEFEKVTDINDIMSYGIMMTPGLVIDDKVVCSGIIPKEEQIVKWLKE